MTVEALARESLSAGRVERAWHVLQEVLDPEVPALSVCDLGIVRSIEVDPVDHRLVVVLTPTYSGCPATEVIERSVVEALQEAGLGPVASRLQRAPAWTTDWISEAGRRKLHDYGIAPPGRCGDPAVSPLRFVPMAARAVEPAQACPRCGSERTERLSAFGSTACKALWRCLACREPFEQFKPI